MATACDVIIIGAGIAGISCANKLKSEGIHNVILLEGRDRLGGRARTDYDLFGIPLDLGASWLHGFEHTTLTKLAIQHNVALEEKKEAKAVIFDVNRGEVDIMELVDVSERIQRFFEAVKPLIKEEGVTIRSAISQFPTEYARSMYTQEELSNVSLKAHKDRVIEFGLQEIEVYNAANVENMSAMSVDSFDPSGDKHVIDGYEKLITALARGLDVRLRHTVSKIEYNPRGGASKENVVITTDKGVFKAAYCCVTLPLGVLKADKVVFSPPLSSHKRGAIERVGFGLMDKVILQYSEPVPLWEKDIDYIGILPHPPPTGGKLGPLNHTFGWMYNLDTLFPGSNTYVWYVSGDYAEYLESLTNTEVAQIAHDELEQVRLGLQKAKNISIKPLPKLLKCRVTRWKQDQYCLGAYSFWHTKTQPGDFEIVAEPIANCITFAGEACSSKQYGMVNAAYDTGMVAATTITKWAKATQSKL